MTEPVELDEAARDVIAAGREGVAPNDFVAERLRRSVERTLRGSAPPPRSRRRAAAVLLAFGAAALGGVLYASQLVLKNDDAQAPPAPAVPAAPAVVAAPAPAPLPGPSVPVPASPPAGAVAVPPGHAAEHAPSTSHGEGAKPSRSQQLGAEIELLARVNAAVNSGQGGRALGLLGEYDRKFRPGILREERAAASVLALCAAGRVAEARTAAERFAKSSPRSPLLGRIAGSCAGKR